MLKLDFTHMNFALDVLLAGTIPFVLIWIDDHTDYFFYLKYILNKKVPIENRVFDYWNNGFCNSSILF